MNKKESTATHKKLLVVFLVATMAIFAFGLVADGWQEEKENLPESGNVPDNNEDDADKDKENTPEIGENNGADKEPEVYIPEYINFLTGLETTEEISRKRPISYLITTNSPLYSVSRADILTEFPIEDGTTRLLATFRDHSSLDKIGSLCSSRNYIAKISATFSSILVSAGKDPSLLSSDTSPKIPHLDVSTQSGYHYTEYSQFYYTSGSLTDAGFSALGISTALADTAQMPFDFNSHGSDRLKFDDTAKTVILPFTDISETELYFESKSGKYSFYKNGTVKTDNLTSTSPMLDNIFVLFADTLTYEGEAGTEMLMQTSNGGKGYYITEGTKKNIVWTTDSDGELVFSELTGERLTVNRGRSYIGFMRSSRIDQVKIY